MMCSCHKEFPALRRIITLSQAISDPRDRKHERKTMFRGSASGAVAKDPLNLLLRSDEENRAVRRHKSKKVSANLESKLYPRRIYKRSPDFLHSTYFKLRTGQVIWCTHPVCLLTVTQEAAIHLLFPGHKFLPLLSLKWSTNCSCENPN